MREIYATILCGLSASILLLADANSLTVQHYCGSSLTMDERIWGRRAICPDCNRFINLTGPKPKSLLDDVGDVANMVWKELKPGLTYIGGQFLRSLIGG